MQTRSDLKKDEQGRDKVITPEGEIFFKIVADEKYRAAVRRASQDPVYRSGADFAKVLADDYAIKGDVVKRAGIRGP